jgi:hypothetical protein
MPTLPGLGRLRAPDPRDHRYLISDTPAAKAVVARHTHTWGFRGPPADQGQTGTCVAHGWKHWLATKPVQQSPLGKPPAPFEIYDWCIANDEFCDNDHDTDRQMGTSVRAGAKYMAAHGYVATYNWAFDLDTAIDWLTGVDAAGKYVGGPVVIGVNWYSSMFDTAPNGYLQITPTATIAGEHCVCLIGADSHRGYVTGLQSWALPWGYRGTGRFRLAYDTLARLIKEDGEVCTAAEIKQVRRP